MRCVTCGPVIFAGMNTNKNAQGARKERLPEPHYYLNEAKAIRAAADAENVSVSEFVREAAKAKAAECQAVS